MLVVAFTVAALFGNRQDEAVQVTQQPVGALNENITITVADYEFTRELYVWRIDRFHEQHPEIDVQFVPFDDVVSNTSIDYQQLASLADTIALPDLPASLQSNVFIDLQSFANDDALDPRDFWPGLLEQGCRMDARMIGLPVSVRPSLIYFDPDAFDTAGLPHPAPGWTWDDFRFAAQTLARANRYGFVDRGQPLKLLGPIVDAYVTGTNVAVDQLSLQLGWYVDLARAGALHTSANEDSGEGLIRDGRAATWVGTLADYERLDASLDNAIGFAPFPIGDAVSNSTPASVSCIAISAGTSHPQAAWAWLHFLSTEPLQREVGDTAARIDVAESRAYYGYDHEETPNVFRFALRHAWYGDLADTRLLGVDAALKQALKGESDLAFALTQVSIVPTVLPVEQDVASIVVATPIATATPAPVSASDVNAVHVDYYADFINHANASTIKTLAQEFNRTHPNIIVNVIDSVEQFRVSNEPIAVDANWLSEHFDCFAQGGGAGRYYSDDLFADLDPLLDADTDGAAFLNDFDQALLELSSAGGKLYRLPVASQPIVIYYNADHLAELGLDPPVLDWTIADFWVLAQAATTDTVYGFTAGWRGLSGIEFLLAARGIQLYDTNVDPPVVHFDDPDVIGALLQLADAARDDIVYPIKDGGTHVDFGNLEQRLPLIKSGNIALWTNRAGFRYGLITGQPEIPLRFKVGVVPLPNISGLLPAPDNSTALYISRQSDHPAACWEWIKFLSAQPNAFRGVPARTSVLELPDLEAAVGIDVAETYRAMQARPSRSAGQVSTNPKLWPVQRWWEDALAQSFGAEAPEVALAEAQRKADAYLDCIATISDEQLSGDDANAARIDCALQVDPEWRYNGED